MDRSMRFRFLGEDVTASKTAKSVGTAVAGTEKNLQQLGRTGTSEFQRIGSTGAKYLGAAVLGAALKSSVDEASNLAESVSKVNVVFGQSAPEIEKFARAGNAIGMSDQKAAEFLGTFGNLFKALGLAEKPTVDMSKAIVTLGADLASFNNLGIEETLEKLRSGLVGEVEPLRSLGVSFTAVDVANEAVRLGLARTNAEVTEGAKVQARYALILKQTKTAQGDFARTSDGLANKQRILASEFADAKAALGEQLLPVMLEATKVAGGFLGFLGDNPGVTKAAVRVAEVAGALYLVNKALKVGQEIGNSALATTVKRIIATRALKKATDDLTAAEVREGAAAKLPHAGAGRAGGLSGVAATGVWALAAAAVGAATKSVSNVPSMVRGYKDAGQARHLYGEFYDTQATGAQRAFLDSMRDEWVRAHNADLRARRNDSVLDTVTGKQHHSNQAAVLAKIEAGLGPVQGRAGTRSATQGTLGTTVSLRELPSLASKASGALDALGISTARADDGAVKIASDLRRQAVQHMEVKAAAGGHARAMDVLRDAELAAVEPGLKLFEITKKQAAAYRDGVSAVRGSYNAFDEAPKRARLTAKQVVDRITKQLGYQRELADATQQLVAKGVEGPLLEELRGLEKTAPGTLAEVARKSTPEFVAKLNDGMARLYQTAQVIADPLIAAAKWASKQAGAVGADAFLAEFGLRVAHRGAPASDERAGQRPQPVVPRTATRPAPVRRVDSGKGPQQAATLRLHPDDIQAIGAAAARGTLAGGGGAAFNLGRTA